MLHRSSPVAFENSTEEPCVELNHVRADTKTKQGADVDASLTRWDDGATSSVTQDTVKTPGVHSHCKYAALSVCSGGRHTQAHSTHTQPHDEWRRQVCKTTYLLFPQCPTPHHPACGIQFMQNKKSTRCLLNSPVQGVSGMLPELSSTPFPTKQKVSTLPHAVQFLVGCYHPLTAEVMLATLSRMQSIVTSKE